MSERNDRVSIDAAWLRGMTQPRFGRRDFMRYAGIGAGALSLSAILAACGESSSTTNPGASGGNVFSGPIEDQLNFANWPLYIDKAKDDSGNVYYPSLERFKKDTGVTVNYQDIIDANADFFGKIQPQLAAGDDTGYDIIVITNGREFTALTNNEWVTPLDTTKRPNFDANAASWAKDPGYDPGNKYSMAWQSGITGIGVNRDIIDPSIEITKADDLMDPSKVGSDQVGMITGDSVDWTMIQLGIDPVTSGPDEWNEAAAWLEMLKGAGTLRKFYDQGYIDDFLAGNLSATMAWSGDVLGYGVWYGYNFEYVFPADGALLWIDNMLIPQNAAHPVAALTLMDYVYQPEIAQMITEWVLYMSPVPETQQLIRDHAQKAFDDGDKGYANKLTQTADSPYLYPDAEFLSRTSFGRNLTTDEEAEEYDSIFDPVFNS
jgi:spermidine/putrescine transport system substrate-binding protein